MMYARRLVMVALLMVVAPRAWTLEWNYLAPNPAYSRDLAMGASTMALFYPPQSQSINPAGLSAFETKSTKMVTVYFNPGGLWQLRNYAREESEGRSGYDQALESARLLVNSVAVRWKIATLAGMFAQPVMLAEDAQRYQEFEESSGLSSHENSLLLELNLHRRISVAGRIDRYYHYTDPDGEGYSYGVILRPNNVDVAVQYQRFPASGAHVWHPLDRRRDQAVSAGVALEQGDWIITAQVMNLTGEGDSLALEPHLGGEWRPMRHLGMRLGIMSFSESERWAWTTGFSLLDANWFRDHAHRLPVPDDILQVAVAVLYDRRTPALGIGSLTLSWRL